MRNVQWQQQFQSERARLLDALGRVTEGGILESMQHIGATSIPGLSGSPCVDIGMAVWPFPLEAEARFRLEALGYQVVEGFSESRQQRFQHTSGSFQLFFFEPGTDECLDFVLLSDYLHHSDTARDQLSACKADAAPDKTILFAELLPRAHTWWIEHYGFSPVEAAANELKNAPFEWYISSGWALDLFLGRVGRVHHDVDVVVPRSSQMELQKYLRERGWKLLTPFEKRLEAWPVHMRLELPRHQVRAHREDQFMDLLLTDMQDVWRYRREPTILRSREKMSMRSESGIPYLAPELVLLFKSRNTGTHERTKDQSDFERALAHMDPERRAWLYWALIATSPDHDWIRELK
jgi:GrpB-like predicted nucleotidyltransferase (UPF0157 family)